MKRINKYLGIAALLFTMSACEKNLDITPTQSIDEEQALRTSSDVEAALIGAYSDMGDADVYGGNIMLISELLGGSNNFNWTGTFQGLTQLYNKATPVNNVFVRDTWLDTYQVINDVNNVLSALDVVLPARKARVEGEAKFIRGALYFELVRLYAKSWNDGDPATNEGVPLILTPTRAPLNESSNVARAKVSEVYAQAIKDLTDAEALLPAGQVNNVFASRYAAAAMLARIYLQQGNYEQAGAAANRVIAANRYRLVDIESVFPFNPQNLSEDTESPAEYIFSIAVTNSAGINELNTYFSTTGRGDIDLRENFVNQFEPDDLRLDLIYDDGGLRTAKYDMVFGNVPVVRLAEMYLIRAEANFRRGTTVGATPLSDVNLIRQRAGLQPLTGGQLTLESILKERRLELAFEGLVLHDVKRLQASVGPLAWNSPKLVLPIPERERQVNPNLTQNEGY
jgi:tetratricopeptide (TPR) repeat protein